LNKTIEIIVSPTGEAKVETKGFIGGECRLASQFVEQALGQRTSEQLKGEFYNSQQAGQDLRQSS
jgi:predicted lipase